MLLGERIRLLRKKKGLSLEELAESIGTSRQTVHRYETGVISNIPHEKVEGMARALGTTPSILMGWEEKRFLSTNNNIRRGLDAEESSDLKGLSIFEATDKTLPMLGNVACGEPIFASEEQGYHVKVGSDMHADFCLKAKGDSMINARIFDGDILFVRKQESVDNGEIAVVLIDDEATVKRVYLDRENGILTLIPENPTYKPLRYMGSELNRIRILGKVVSGQYKI